MFERLLDSIVEAVEAPVKEPGIKPSPTQPKEAPPSPLKPTPGVNPKPKAEEDEAENRDAELFVEARKK